MAKLPFAVNSMASVIGGNDIDWHSTIRKGYSHIGSNRLKSFYTVILRFSLDSVR